MKEAWNAWAASLKTNTYALYLASKDPDVPWLAKAVIVLVVAYALSPIDLIPDFIPIIGYLDDFILLPAGVWIAVRLIPKDAWQRCQQSAQRELLNLPANWWAGLVIVVLWFLSMAALLLWIWPLFASAVAT